MTKSTDSNDAKLGLTSQQEEAANLIAMGETVSAAAKKVRCTVQALREWLDYDPIFLFAVELRRSEGFQTNVLRLRSLVPTAIDVLEKQLKGANAIQAAAEILRLAALQNAPSPLIPQDLRFWNEFRQYRELQEKAIAEKERRRKQRKQR